MKFDRLRLVGFKSFVEPTDFEIKPGLTGIIGPNGCGKSNLLEALRWVMGATSAKALRGGGMEDVIFSGTNARPARSWAEATLSLDNSARTLPAAFNDSPDMEITRRITRKADGAQSDYKINGKPARAKDVQLLFADAATGANSPALVRQGQIAELIDAKPQNRRKLLEEAAGITGLHARRHESELRLKAAETSLERLDDVTSELGVQRAALARQARQAKRYRTLSGAIREAEAMVAYLRWRDATLARDASAAELTQMRALLEEAARKAAGASNAQSKAHERLEPLRLKEAAAAAALHRLEVEQENLETELLRLQEEAGRAAESHAQLVRDRAREHELGTDAVNAIHALDAEAQSINTRIVNEGGALAAAVTSHAAAQDRMDAAQAAFDRINGLASTREAERRSFTLEKDTLAARLEKLNAALGLAKDDVNTLKPGAGERQQLTDAEEALQLAEVTRMTAEKKLIDHEMRQHEARRAEEDLRTPKQRLGEEMTALRTEAETIVRMLHGNNHEGSLPVMEEMAVDAGYETALAAALGDDLNAPLDVNAAIHWSAPAQECAPRNITSQNITSQNITSQSIREDAAEGAQKAAQKAAQDSSSGIGDAATGDIAGAGMPPLPEGATALAHHVRAPAELAARLQSIGVVSPAAGHRLQALLKPGQRLVSREGDMWRWDGYVSRAEAKTPAATRLEQRNRLAQLERRITDGSDRHKDAIRRHDTARRDLEAAQAADKEARLDLKKHEQTCRAAQQTLARLEAARTTAAARHDAQLAALERLRSDIAECTERHIKAHEAVAALPDIPQLKQDVEAARTQLLDARRLANESRLTCLDLKREQETRTERLEAITPERRTWTERSTRARTRLEEMDARLEDIKVTREAAKDRPDEIEHKRQGLFDRLTAAEAAHRAAGDSLTTAQALTADADAALKAAETEAVELREARARLEARHEAAIDRVDEAQRLARETCNAEPEGLPEIAGHDIHDDLPERAEIDPQLEKYRAERERLGSVNLRADVEMTEIDARLEELGTEQDDCASAIKKLRHAINDLNREGRERLVSAFETVNFNFGDLFKQLFGGGQAELRLIDSDDPLEAGLEIYACPPGKKLTAMSLMSGGEQALTATALIFAVFLANPAPVCVLDEVDAPLDDANTERFCKMLHRMAADTETRFICITHHALTMSRMDRLYGVTMIEHGVSQLVSVDLSKATGLVAAE